MLYTVDRIEGEYAVCVADDESVTNIALASLPFEAAEGEVFELSDGVYTLRRGEKAERSEKIQNLFDKLKKRGKIK